VEYRVEELAGAAGMRVDTVRFYQARGLLPAPRREGRAAIYDESHLARLRRIRALKQDGFSLAQIERVLGPEASSGGEPLLQALVEESVGTRTLSRDELAREAGVPEALVRAAESMGILAPVAAFTSDESTAAGGDSARFTEADLELARAGLAILEAGIPLTALLEPTSAHVRNTEVVCEQAIDLFDEFVRKSGPAADNADAISAVFRSVLPQVTKVVALHFQRTLVNRALGRLEAGEADPALEAALAAADAGRLEVEWR